MQIPSYLTPPFPDNGTFLEARGTLSQCTSFEQSPNKVGGSCIFRGTRVPVRALFETLEDGASVDEFLEWFLAVGRGPVEAVLEYASASLEEPFAA
jgi:uncharacterized protein (DUF433 family)